MNSIEKNTEKYLDAFRTHFNGEAKQAFHATREKAVDTFSRLGFPSTKKEEWRFTNVAEISRKQFSPAGRNSSETVSVSDVEKFMFSDWDGPVLVVVNGYFKEKLSNLDSLSDKVKVESLAKILDNNDKAANKLGQNAIWADEAFTALNTAFTKDGCVITVDANSENSKPVHLMHISTGDAILSSPRTVVNINKNANITIVESFHSLNSKDSFTNIVSEIFVDENAHLKHYKLQDVDTNSFLVGNCAINQNQNSTYQSVAMDFGGKLVRNNISLALNGENISSILNGLYIAQGEQHIDNHTFIDHAQPHCESHELYRGILKDKAKGVFSGKILVRQDAQKTDAKQSNNCLLLSEDARIDTKPQLEIYADDVKCTHGATVGQLDESALFYLRARGVPYKKAMSILTYAFAEEVIDSIKTDAFKNKVEALLLERLEKSLV
ncbi:MAG: Fe-S cluster assembly protein SufD [Calditrichae bacterium]|nr:Fe-S cluster assembly protein SufD [Calditrichota bacterium]MCB9057086.1 Fe-S cluster assembly protein SufD [Calditrichia bacterium]